jgi:hypothetical protein
MICYGAVLRVLVVGCLTFALTTFALAQAPADPGVPEQMSVHADMLQVMRSILYPASNVIFTAQSADPASFEPAARMSTSPNPFTAAYGQWQAVELAGLALVESANLLTLPRLCGNGRPAPVQDAAWQLWVQEVRDAGMTAYEAAQTQSQDAILDAAGAVSDSCLHCHEQYRQVPGGFEARCPEPN